MTVSAADPAYCDVPRRVIGALVMIATVILGRFGNHSVAIRRSAAVPVAEVGGMRIGRCGRYAWR